MGIGVLVLEVSWTAELFAGEGVPGASGVVTGVCRTAVVLTKVSSTRVVGMGVGGNLGHRFLDYFLMVFPIQLYGSCQWLDCGFLYVMSCYQLILIIMEVHCEVL